MNEINLNEETSLGVELNFEGDTVGGISPTVTTTAITGGTQVKIHDVNGDHAFNVMNGANGADAKINGVNTLSMVAGTNITLDQEGSTLTISASGGSGGTSDHAQLINRDASNQHPISAINGLQTALDGKASSSHTHDDRYYTETETDTLLNGKANTSHTHTKSAITDFPAIPSKTSELTNDSGFLTAHQSLSAYRTSADQDVIDATKQDTIVAGTNISIGADGKTINATDTTYSAGDFININAGNGIEVDVDTLEERLDEDGVVWNGFSHTNNDIVLWSGSNGNQLKSSGKKLANYQEKTDTTLTTTDKTVVGAINEVNANKSAVSVSASGTSTDEVGYITINGVEKKLPSGGGGGGVTLYEHNITIYNQYTTRNVIVTFKIINQSATPLNTTASICAYLNANDMTYYAKLLPASGCYIDTSGTSTDLIVEGIYYSNSTSFNIQGHSISNPMVFNTQNLSAGWNSSIRDAVIQLN